MGAGPPRVVYLVSEDWYFMSHRLPMARAAAWIGMGVVFSFGRRISGHRYGETGMGPERSRRVAAQLKPFSARLRSEYCTTFNIFLISKKYAEPIIELFVSKTACYLSVWQDR